MSVHTQHLVYISLFMLWGLPHHISYKCSNRLTTLDATWQGSSDR